METETETLYRREHRTSKDHRRRKVHADMPSPNTPEAITPTPNMNNTIARSMSRYKGSRPRVPPRSLSTPSVPPIPTSEHSAEPKDKALTRPRTTFDTNQTTNALDFAASSGEEEFTGGNHGDVGQSSKLGETASGGGGISLGRNEPKKGLRVDSRSRQTSQDQSRRMLPNDQDRKRNVVPVRPAIRAKKSFTQRMVGLVSQPQSAAEAKIQMKQMISSPIQLESETPAPVPSFDAPKSAVNAGERSVNVKYQDFLVPVVVTPSTTSANIVRSVAEKTMTQIDPNCSVIIESFKQLGLERPLRRYEHIRDVLNSWDTDGQNTLIIEPSSTGGTDNDLDLKGAPRKQPAETSFHMYHSQRPGHWDKRWISIRPDGQMLVAKSSGGETTNICHLSDFDIYIPTPKQLAKRTKPPKKICFAVKSQLKSSMFMSTINFVHFFCSSDRKRATALYKAVHEWRSWYLVNVMGKGMGQINEPANKQASKVANRGAASDRPNQLTNRPHDYNLDKLQSPDIQKDKPGNSTTRPPLLTSRQATHKELDSELRSSQRKNPVRGNIADPSFSEDSLLGKTYARRQQELRDQERNPASNPSIPPPPYPSGTARAEDTTGIKRSSSQRRKPKPLVDLTPVYQEPPQHARKGRGVIPKQLPPGGLVDIATSPEVAIAIPPPTSWRRPGTSGGPAEVSPPRAATIRNVRPTAGREIGGLPGLDYERASSKSPDKRGAAFIGGMLADSTEQDGGRGRIGRVGVTG